MNFSAAVRPQPTTRIFHLRRPESLADPQTLLRVARLPGRFAHVQLSPATLDQMQVHVAAGSLRGLLPAQFWTAFSAGLMQSWPSRTLVVLRESRALQQLLPEVAALFGVPQSAEEPPVVDVGYHQLRLLDAAAALQAPLPVRFAGLMHKLGKAGTPQEILPSHYKHEQRGAALLEALCRRYPVPEDCRELALLAINEVDRIHRASDMRAGALASLLERVQALEQPERFEQLLQVCSCDYQAYPWRPAPGYPKAERLRRAYSAFRRVNPGQLAADELLSARAKAIAGALGRAARQ